MKLTSYRKAMYDDDDYIDSEGTEVQPPNTTPAAVDVHISYWFMLIFLHCIAAGAGFVLGAINHWTSVTSWLVWPVAIFWAYIAWVAFGEIRFYRKIPEDEQLEIFVIETPIWRLIMTPIFFADVVCAFVTASSG